ncbi:hypothetical protein M427DRAFT_68456 [Gonapodya prolifera JEL478]|uniref:Uncharacterized protein n=1 Tax=Gonapodya prolifera (strain JEL478) TaxID=1344416 RepID=A0A139AL99_GONPJ|nr:hypothetical protein M427DRAFT_68456 [Gonapodya prolifera JEL478]|eukprot:KXS17314.1 hypothetical protein M427DRAFT_68456 [Gonapodya prolifera JEL478]
MASAQLNADLIAAIETGTVATVSDLLRSGASPRTRKTVTLRARVDNEDGEGGWKWMTDTVHGESALALAILSGRRDVVKLLLTRGADVVAAVSWRTPNWTVGSRTWTRDEWEKARWGWHYTFPSHIALATARDGVARRWDRMRWACPSRDGIVEGNRKGGEVLVVHPVGRDDAVADAKVTWAGWRLVGTLIERAATVGKGGSVSRVKKAGAGSSSASTSAGASTRSPSINTGRSTRSTIFSPPSVLAPSSQRRCTRDGEAPDVDDDDEVPLQRRPIRVPTGTTTTACNVAETTTTGAKDSDAPSDWSSVYDDDEAASGKAEGGSEIAEGASDDATWLVGSGSFVVGPVGGGRGGEGEGVATAPDTTPKLAPLEVSSTFSPLLGPTTPVVAVPDLPSTPTSTVTPVTAPATTGPDAQDSVPDIDDSDLALLDALISFGTLSDDPRHVETDGMADEEMNMLAKLLPFRSYSGAEEAEGENVVEDGVDVGELAVSDNDNSDVHDDENEYQQSMLQVLMDTPNPARTAGNGNDKGKAKTWSDGEGLGSGAGLNRVA